jgi:hypothetical protein
VTSDEELREGLISFGSDIDYPRAPVRQDPTSGNVKVEQHSAERAACVRPTLSQVYAGTRKRPPPAPHGVDIDAECRQFSFPERRDREIAPVGGTDDSQLATFNEIYARYFPVQPPARIFICVPRRPGPFDIEIDCVAML